MNALDLAGVKGAQYADIRLVNTTQERWVVRNGVVDTLSNDQSFRLLRSYMNSRKDVSPYLFISNRMLPIDRRPLQSIEDFHPHFIDDGTEIIMPKPGTEYEELVALIAKSLIPEQTFKRDSGLRDPMATGRLM